MLRGPYVNDIYPRPSLLTTACSIDLNFIVFLILRKRKMSPLWRHLPVNRQLILDHQLSVYRLTRIRKHWKFSFKFIIDETIKLHVYFRGRLREIIPKSARKAMVGPALNVGKGIVFT